MLIFAPTATLCGKLPLPPGGFRIPNVCVCSMKVVSVFEFKRASESLRELSKFELQPNWVRIC